MPFEQSSDAPILTLSPHHTSQPEFYVGSQRRVFNSAVSNGSPLHSWSKASPSAPTPDFSSAAGRKRSRDDAAFNEDDYILTRSFATIEPEESTNDAAWVYGEGMTTMKPNTNHDHTPAESQTGTWAKYQAEKEIAQAIVTHDSDRHLLRSTKSQRLDLTSTPVLAEKVSSSNGQLLNSLPLCDSNSGPVEPTIDDFTRYLGVGWSSVSANDNIKAALRGWTKYIEHHFPIHDVQFRLQSKGLQSYLIEAREGYFLFGEELKQCQMVSTSLQRTFTNLRGPVPEFDDAEVMEAGATLKTMSSLDGSMIDAVSQSTEMEMDMS